MKTKHFPVINTFLCSNSVLKVSRDLSEDPMTYPEDDHTREDEDIDDKAITMSSNPTKVRICLRIQ